jgi:hypothetical protein
MMQDDEDIRKNIKNNIDSNTSIKTNNSNNSNFSNDIPIHQGNQSKHSSIESRKSYTKRGFLSKKGILI